MALGVTLGRWGESNRKPKPVKEEITPPVY